MKQQAGGKDRALAHLQEKANSAADKEKISILPWTKPAGKLPNLQKNNETLTADLNAKAQTLMKRRQRFPGRIRLSKTSAPGRPSFRKKKKKVPIL